MVSAAGKEIWLQSTLLKGRSLNKRKSLAKPKLKLGSAIVV